MRTGLLVAAGWATAVVAATAASWSAVSVVRTAVAPSLRTYAPSSVDGDGPTDAGVHGTSAAAATSPGRPASTPPSGRGSPSRGSGGRGPGASSGSDDGSVSGSGSGSGSTPGGSGSSPGSGSTSGRSPGGSGSADTPTQTSTAPAQNHQQIRVSGTGGTAVITCNGLTPAFVNAAPRVGFRERAGDGAEIRFESDTHRTDITASCTAGGVPHGSVRERESGGGGGGGGGSSGGSGSGSESGGKGSDH